MEQLHEKYKGIIPPITDPLGRHWEQPKVSDIILDEKYAAMSQKTFDELKSYDRSFPSGVYPGKMWKRAVYKNDSNDIAYHVLIWYGHHETPGYCSNNYREILIIE